MLFRKPKATDETTPMRAVEIARAESGGILYATHVPKPIAGPGELLIKVAYAGINRADLLQVAGSYMPPEGASPLPGLEVSGSIAEIGDGVIGWSVGEEVCALLSGGGYAEYVAVPAAQVLALPHKISLKEAASLPEAAATAYMALIQSAALKPGERVLIHGGASGVGLMLIQVARMLGAEVFATAGGAEKCAFVKSLGAHAIDHHAGAFTDQLMKLTNHEGVNVIIDILGAPALATHLKLLRPGGRLVMLAMMDGNVVESLKIGSVLMKHLTLTGTTLRSQSAAQKAAIMEGVKKRIWPHVATGAIAPRVDSVFPLELAEKAHQRMQERLHCGKILLEVPLQDTNGD
jgi:putative PIG3 family NAD(P)H quinone oxidoreductase